LQRVQCCPNTPVRKVTRDIDENAYDVARRKMSAKAFLKSRDQRKRVEMRFAHLKIMASNSFGSAACRVAATSSISPPSCRSSSRWPAGSSVHHRCPAARKLRSVGAGGVGCVSVEADARIGRRQKLWSPKFLPAQPVS
jgi:hypothetical protein